MVLKFSRKFGLAFCFLLMLPQLAFSFSRGSLHADLEQSFSEEIIFMILSESSPQDWPKWARLNRRFLDRLNTEDFRRGALRSILKATDFVSFEEDEYNVQLNLSSHASYPDWAKYKLHVKGFRSSKFVVSQLFWFLVMKNHPNLQIRNPSTYKNKGDCPETYIKFQGTSICPDLPVDNVRYIDLHERDVGFLDQLNSLRLIPSSEQFEIPSEIQWEILAGNAGSNRHPIQMTFLEFLTSKPAQIDRHAWTKENSLSQSIRGKTRIRTHSPGSKIGNSYGITDVYGNVRQWVKDGYQSAPDFSSKQIQDANVHYNYGYIAKGSSYSESQEELLSGLRKFVSPQEPGFQIGVRIIIVPKSSEQLAN